MPAKYHAHSQASHSPSSRQSPDSQVNLELFREKVAEACRQVGRLQRELANELSIDSKVLSRKLHGAKQNVLNHEQVKQVVKTLAGWDAISTQAEAIELLTLMGLRRDSFSGEEWKAAPFNRLEPPRRDSARMVGASTAHPAMVPLPVASTSLIGREAMVQTLLDRMRLP